jgi:NAD-dependent dihydropyrimidine dehydrogenase PreA subunit/flavodoxin
MMKIGIFYFSGSGVTEKYAKLMKDQLVMKECNVELVNITSHLSREQHFSFENFDGVIFGFPVYIGFAPRVVNDWISLQKGNHKPCGMFFTYGGGASGFSHYHTQQLLTGAGFDVLCSAEFLGPHTFNVGGWKVCLDRPNDQDIDAAKKYVDLLFDAFDKKTNVIYSISKPLGYEEVIKGYLEMPPRKERWITNPVRVAESCSMCRTCEQECPTGAFDAETGLSDPEKCIECMHCIFVCSDKVVKVPKEVENIYPVFLERYHVSEEIIKNKESLIFQ